MNRSEVDPRVKDIVHSSYGNTQMEYWEALYYMEEENSKAIRRLCIKHGDSQYSMYLDIIRGIRTEEFLIERTRVI